MHAVYGVPAIRRSGNGVVESGLYLQGDATVGK